MSAREQNFEEQKNESIHKKAFVFWLSGILLIAVDQVSKLVLFSKNFPFPLVHFKNSYFAFSLPVPTFVMYAVYAVVFGFSAKYVYKNFRNLNKLSRLAWLLIFAGGISNILERMVLGYVRDYLYIFSGVFNGADMYILAGIGILLFQPLTSNPHDS